MDMDMSGMDMSMSSSAMSGGSISIDWIPRVYWLFVGSLIAFFTLTNILDYVLFRQRIVAAARNHPFPARPTNPITRAYATLNAVSRELSNASLPSLRLGRVTIRTPSLGAMAIVTAHLVLVTVLCLLGFNLKSILEFEYVGYRTGIVSMAQLPLIFLLAGKNNIIGLVTGMSYERLNWLHRWTARSLLLTSTLHMGYWFGSWAPYGDYISYMATHDRTTKEGIIAWAILAWLVLSSFAPIRGWSYEIFVLQHTISYIALIVGIWFHTPPATHGWIWAPVAVYFLDKLTRAGYAVYLNLAIFHPKEQGNPEAKRSFWACQATLTPLPDNTTRVTIANPPLTWQPGQHAFLSAHTIAPLQSHPFTIASLPSDGKLEFLIKAHRGGTKRFFSHAQKLSLTLPSLHDPVPSEGAKTTVTIEGPYGRMRPLRQFDSVVLFAASTGATFTVPLLRDIVRQWRNAASTSPESQSRGLLRTPDIAATRHIRFIWVIKSRSQLSWFATQLNQAMLDVQELRAMGRDVELEASVYVTCDERLTSDYNTSILHPSGPASNNAGVKRIEAHSAPSYTSDTASEHSEDSKSTLKKEQGGDETIGIREIDPRSESLSTTSSDEKSTSTTTTTTATTKDKRDNRDKPKTCGGANNTCCCITTIVDESSAASTDPRSAICRCNHSSSSSSSSSIATPTSTTLTPTTTTTTARQPDTTSTNSSSTKLHPRILQLSGRPHPASIINKSLDQATGETAVVVCGPKGLNDDVRLAVVRVSDERALLKGGGKGEGIWFWGEGFGW